jgi:hypothetical protein
MNAGIYRVFSILSASPQHDAEKLIRPDANRRLLFCRQRGACGARVEKVIASPPEQQRGEKSAKDVSFGWGGGMLCI